MSDKAIRVLLVDDHAMVRKGLQLILNATGDIQVAACAESTAEAFSKLKEQEFDVALVDIAMPGKNGLDLLRQIRDSHPKLPVLVLSMYDEEVYAVRALKLGAAGYLTKNSQDSILIDAIRKAAAGGKYISAKLAEKLASLIGGQSAFPHETLSDRELEVLKLIAAGESLVRIAAMLHLSPNTVTTYRARIMGKLQAKSNSDLTHYAIEHGLRL
ncbi:response regulator [Noviherbaspirillum autotrophicum]|uniref:LuxR family transcriptional regulator n=1 Tax=Noviherbaspirillum autotrophicum TaxID=709839 RepID=A0A0C2BQY6_9BURK|nr:response regulator transcription factor [Noviherbaspirillum autotrophicum]KIF82479.1 LuxR family transcriptional regulator [Noviherbaspirillum autotrophicum]